MRRKKRSRRRDHIVHKDKDLRIPTTTPEELARAVLSGGAKPRQTRPAT